MPRVEIKEIEHVRLKDPVIVEGFPGIGMVGTISASFLADKLGMKLVGYLASNLFPPIAAIHDFKPVSPARIYASEKYNLFVLYSEFVIPAHIVFPLAQEIIAWAKKHNARAIYSLAGIASPQPQPDRIYGIASTPGIAEELKEAGIDLIREGATQGVSGVLIAEAAAQGFPAGNIMIQTNQPLDPRGSAKLLDKFSEIIDIRLDTTPLITEAEKIENRMGEAINKLQSMGKSYQDLEQKRIYG
jgi:uncharacterized protein